ncbi:hypothetical protein Tco_1286348, partial [Tanacetum coccineum]
MEGSISDEESSNDGWRRWESHEITYHDHDEIKYENEIHDERQELCEAYKLPVCNMRRFKMIKYSFGQDEEYVAVKEDEYDDLPKTSDDACRAYQEIFRMMDEGWMDLVKEISTNIGGKFTNLEIMKCWSLETSRIWYDEDVRSVETEFPATVFNDSLTFEETPSCEPTVSPLNDNKIDFRISFDEFDDEDYMVIYDKNSFSYKIISVDDLKTDSENDNDKVNMPSFSSPKPTVSYFDDLDFFKDFENEFPAIVYNDALT